MSRTTLSFLNVYPNLTHYVDTMFEGCMLVAAHPRPFSTTYLSACFCQVFCHSHISYIVASHPTNSDCSAFWGAGKRSGTEFADAHKPDRIALHEFVTTLCESLIDEEHGLGDAFHGGVAWVGLGHRLVQPHAGGRYIKHQTLLCSVAAKDPGPDIIEDVKRRLEDAVSFGYITAGLTVDDLSVSASMSALTIDMAMAMATYSVVAVMLDLPRVHEHHSITAQSMLI